MIRSTMAGFIVALLYGCSSFPAESNQGQVSIRCVYVDQESPKRAFVSLRAAAVPDAVSPLHFEDLSALDERGTPLEVTRHEGFTSSTGSMTGWYSRSPVPPHTFVIATQGSKIALLRGSLRFKRPESTRDVVLERPAKGSRFRAGEFVAEIADIGEWGVLVRFKPEQDEEAGAEELRLRLSGAETVFKDGTTRTASKVTAWGRGKLQWVFDGEIVTEMVGDGVLICFDNLQADAVATLRFRFVDSVASSSIRFELRDLSLP